MQVRDLLLLLQRHRLLLHLGDGLLPLQALRPVLCRLHLRLQTRHPLLVLQHLRLPLHLGDGLLLLQALRPLLRRLHLRLQVRHPLLVLQRLRLPFRRLDLLLHLGDGLPVRQALRLPLGRRQPRLQVGDDLLVLRVDLLLGGLRRSRRHVLDLPLEREDGLLARELLDPVLQARRELAGGRQLPFQVRDALLVLLVGLPDVLHLLLVQDGSRSDGHDAVQCRLGRLVGVLLLG